MVTCGWYGKCEVDRERPPAYGVGEQLALRRCPRRRVTKTTGETGRKVPVPAQVDPERLPHRTPRCSRCSSTAGRSSAAISTGGMRVMWVGICVAVVSPTEVR